MADAKTQKLRRRFAGSFQNDTPAATARDRLSGALRSLRRGGDARPEFVLIPQNLRTSDPGFFAELAAGTMGLAGATVRIEGTSPFRVTPPNDAWRSALLGFGWLNDIRAAQSPEAQGLAQETVEQWIVEERPFQSDDWATDVAARRMISWLTNAGMLAEGVPAGSYDRFATSVAQSSD